jgi:group I intron endonuclease
MENAILDEPDEIRGVVYVIEHKPIGDATIIRKQYVGQTLTHRKNHDRYRPFHAEGRFRDHISEALNNTKRKQCTFLNNAIRKYGADAFQVRVLQLCDREDLDTYEQHYIATLNTLYPNGYNLTRGGTGAKAERLVTNESPLNVVKQRGGCTFRSPETRQTMVDRSKERGFTEEEKVERMKHAQAQFANQKAERFVGVQVDSAKMDSYIHLRTNGTVVVIIGKARTSFVGKYETQDELFQRAREFVASLQQATLPNCSGNP